MLQAALGLTPVLLPPTPEQSLGLPSLWPAVGREDIDAPPKGAWLLQTLLVHPASAHPGSLSTALLHFFPVPAPWQDSTADLSKTPLKHEHQHG